MRPEQHPTKRKGHFSLSNTSRKAPSWYQPCRHASGLQIPDFRSQLATSLDGSIRVLVGAGDDAILIPVEALLLQAIHHAHEHRTQIETMLGQLGIDPPGLSGWRYFVEQIK